MGTRNSSLSRSETTLGFENSYKSHASTIVRSRSRPWQVDSSRIQDESDRKNENVNFSKRLDNLDFSQNRQQCSTYVYDMKIFSSTLKNSSKKSNNQHSAVKFSTIASANTACRHKLQKIFRVISDRKSAIISLSPTKSPTDYRTIVNKSQLGDNNFAPLKVTK